MCHKFLHSDVRLKKWKKFTKYVVKESNNQKNFMTLVLILKILHTTASTLKWVFSGPAVQKS